MEIGQLGKSCASLFLSYSTLHVHVQWERKLKIEVPLKLDQKLSTNGECLLTMSINIDLAVSSSWLILLLHVPKSSITGKGRSEHLEERIMVGQGSPHLFRGPNTLLCNLLVNEFRCHYSIWLEIPSKIVLAPYFFHPENNNLIFWG